MRRADVVARIQAHKHELRRFNVKGLSLFGSVARDEAGADSDVDVVAEFDGPRGLREYMGLVFFLEELLGVHVDVITQHGNPPRLQERVDRDAYRVA